jgi:SAM-dependent methyltransferase
MHLRDLQKNWNRMGAEDPLWAVATVPQYKGGRWDPTAFFESGRQLVDAILEHAGTLGTQPSGSALDFGCGVGRLSQALAVHFDHVVGVDIAPSMIWEANQRNQRGTSVEYVLNERPDLSLFQDASFDFVCSEITLMHMEPRYSTAYIAEFLRVVRPGGLVVFQLPAPTRRQKLREVIPRPIVYFGNKLRTVRSPMMEIYGLTCEAITITTTEAGGHLIDMHEWQTDDRVDRRYWVRRSAQ